MGGIKIEKLPYPFPKWQIRDSSKLVEFAEENVKFDENGGEFSKGVENTVGKGEIARYEQFLLFPQCFLKTCTALHTRKNKGLFKKGLNGTFFIITICPCFYLH